MDYQVDFTKAYKDLYEGIAAKGGVMGRGKDDEEKKPAAKPDAKAKGGDKKDGEGDESAVKQAVYDIRYRAKREGVPVAQAMTDYLKHSASLGPKARAELKKKLLGEELLDEISADLALTASQKADEVRRKAAISGDRETAAKKAQQASRLYKGVASRRAKERMKEEVDGNLDEGLRDAVKGLLGRGKKEEKKPESRGEQLRKKYNVGPEKSDTSAKRQILNRTRAKAERDKEEFGGSRYSKSVADKSAAAHDRYLRAGYSKYGADDRRGSGNKARKRAAALKKVEVVMEGLVSRALDKAKEAYNEKRAKGGK